MTTVQQLQGEIRDARLEITRVTKEIRRIEQQQGKAEALNRAKAEEYEELVKRVEETQAKLR